jgi:hypothetical protein
MTVALRDLLNGWELKEMVNLGEVKLSEQMIDNVSEYILTMVKIKDSILCLNGGMYIQNHQKTLMFSLLDSMSKGVYGERYRHNSERFEAFILEFCNWGYANRISLQQLALLLDSTEHEEFNELKDFIIKELSKYPMTSPVPFKFDLEIERIDVTAKAYCPPIDGVSCPNPDGQAVQPVV